MAAPFSHRAFARKNAKLKTKSPRPVLGWEGGEVLGEGDQNSGNFMRGPRACHARISANSENFFYLCSMRTWQSRGQETDELRGSFLPPNGNAGGNRPRGHQRRAMEISLDCLTLDSFRLARWRARRSERAKHWHQEGLKPAGRRSPQCDAMPAV